MEGKVNFIIKGRISEEQFFCSSPMCKECNGACCKSCGCVYSPDDFAVFRNPYTHEQRVRYLIAFLNRGKASIDHRGLLDRRAGAINEDNLFSRKRDIISLEKLLRADGALYVRARNRNSPIIDILHSDEKEECSLFISGQGCSLSFARRPKGGRHIKAKEVSFDHCVALYGEDQAAIDWLPYQFELYEVYRRFN